MSKDELLLFLKQCELNHDTEGAHVHADEALLKFINDPEIREAYDKVEKWYA